MQHWYALYTKPNAERQVKETLTSRGLETYLPVVQVWRARRRRIETEALFSCYLFARFDREAIGLSAVAWTPGLRCLVGGEEMPTPVPDEIIGYIRQRTNTMGLPAATQLKPGERVRLIDGPLKELEAIFEAPLSGYDRAQILVLVLGRLTRYQVPLEWLEPAKKTLSRSITSF